jgi:hypothetical protein
MSEIVLKSHITLKSPLPQWLRAAFDWLRQANVAARLPVESVEDLSDRQLRDVGGERKDIAKAMDRELGRIGLLDIGWQQPRRPNL